LWRTDGPNDEGSLEERHPVRWIRIVILALGLTGLGLAMAWGMGVEVLLTVLLAIPSAVAVVAWVYLKARHRLDAGRSGHTEL
jgi:hypothetical protein